MLPSSMNKTSYEAFMFFITPWIFACNSGSDSSSSRSGMTSETLGNFAEAFATNLSIFSFSMEIKVKENRSRINELPKDGRRLPKSAVEF